VAQLEVVPERVRLGEQEPGVERERIDLEGEARDLGEQHAAFRIERGREAERREPRGGPGEDLAGARSLEGFGRLFDLEIVHVTPAATATDGGAALLAKKPRRRNASRRTATVMTWYAHGTLARCSEAITRASPKLTSQTSNVRHTRR